MSGVRGRRCVFKCGSTVFSVSARRSARGFSITEFLMAVVLLGYSMAVIGECAVVSTMGVTSLTTKSDSLSTVRTALERVSADIRQSRALGDYYGQTAERLQFPSSANPMYGIFVPPGGWPAAPWPLAPYKLGPQCLILQQPMFFLDPVNDPTNPLFSSAAAQNTINGFPIMLPKNYIASGVPLYDVEDLDTLVYQVVPDLNRPGEFLLQMIRLPGKPLVNVNSSYRSLINPPQTVLSGIVGPKPLGGTATDPPVVFGFLQKPLPTAPGKLVRTVPTTNNIANIVGVTLDLEVRKSLSASKTTTTTTSSVLGLHQEVALRSSRNMVLYNASN